jgi:methyl-accepting chemotaxis protein
MMDRWTFGKKIGAGFAFAGAVLVLLSVVGFRTTSKLVDDSRWVQHTYEVRATLTELLSALKDAETGARGFVISGEQTFLEPYRFAVGETERKITHLRRLIADNPKQQQRLEVLTALVAERLAEAKRVVDTRGTGGYDAASALVVEAEGKRLMDRLRASVAEMDGEEAQLLDARTKEAAVASNAAQAVLLWGSALGVLAVALMSFVIVRSLIRQIGTAVHQVQSSSTELQAAANQQASGAKEQSSAMTEMTTTISELLATSRQIAESAQRVVQVAEQTAKGARTGNAKVQRAHESIAAIRRQVDAIVGHMLELGSKSQLIGAVLDIVSELAEQTNILAINATIEAADAGDSGRRFGVVADEIRKLADRVAGSAKEIRALVEDVRSSVNTTVIATEAGSKSVDAGASQFADVALAFEEIGGLVSTTTEAAREIELSTKQQTTAVEQVNIAIASITQATRETEVSTEQTLSTATQLSSLSRALQRIVAQTNSQVHLT